MVTQYLPFRCVDLCCREKDQDHEYHDGESSCLVSQVNGATEGAFGAGHQCWGFTRLSGLVSGLLHTPINFRTDSKPCEEEMASRFAGSPPVSRLRRHASTRARSKRVARTALALFVDRRTSVQRERSIARRQFHR